MRTLIDDTVAPPGGWKYYVPETKTTLQANTRDGLKLAYINHCQSNNLPVGLQFWEKIQDQICSGLDENHCYNSERPRHAQSKKLDIGQIVAGTLTLVHWYMSGKKRVDSAEANRRALICSSCEYNQKYEGCQGCNAGKMQGIVESVTGPDKTAFDDKLNACQLCGCALKVKAWLPLDLLLQHTPMDIQEAFPNHCWLKVRETSTST